MHNTSALYDSIVEKANHWFEVSVTIGNSGSLVTERSERILIGGYAILVDSGGASSGYRENQIFSLRTKGAVFANNLPEAGCAVAKEIDLQMIRPIGDIPKMARIGVYVRAADGINVSEWIPKGVYYVDTREVSHYNNGLDVITIHGYDSMLKFEQLYPNDSEHDYPIRDIVMVEFLANTIGITVHASTYDIMQKGYEFPLLHGYSCREALRLAASAYGGNFIITDDDQLLLVTIGGLPPETNYLIDTIGNVLVFGQDRILV